MSFETFLQKLINWAAFPFQISPVKAVAEFPLSQLCQGSEFPTGSVMSAWCGAGVCSQARGSEAGRAAEQGGSNLHVLLLSGEKIFPALPSPQLTPKHTMDTVLGKHKHINHHPGISLDAASTNVEKKLAESTLALPVPER